MARSRSRNVELAVAITRDGRPAYLIAAQARVNPTRFSGIVNGRVVSSAAERRRIAAALGVDEADIFEEDLVTT